MRPPVYGRYRDLFTRQTLAKAKTPTPIVAWDLETTNIPMQKGDQLTVRPKYFTAWGAEGLLASVRLRSLADLSDAFLAVAFTLPNNARMVTWNGNRFDHLLLARALLHHPQVSLRPFLASHTGLRGLRLLRTTHNRKRQVLISGEKPWTIELCDGMAMTGLQISLGKLAATFAPDLPKLVGTINYAAGEEFNARLRAHRAYAERDSQALYAAMTAIDALLLELGKRPARMTIGSWGIKYFQSCLPPDMGIGVANVSLWKSLHEHGGKRGGYTYVSRQYDGPAWQYDLNQAYAAAMRAPLPRGYALQTDGEYRERLERVEYLGAYYCTIARDERSPVPFMCYDLEADERCEAYGDRPVKTFILSIEINTLRKYGWRVDVDHGWVWLQSFDMSEMVDDLERRRAAAGPSSPLGTMIKAVGNNCYGKTIEMSDYDTLAIAARRPRNVEGKWQPYDLTGEDERYYGWWRMLPFAQEGQPSYEKRRNYHRPQIGSFITARVRMQVFEAIMGAPDAFLKADTDSVAFDRPVTHLDVHPSRYGAWKVEYAGTRFLIVGKKTYATVSVPIGAMVALCPTCGVDVVPSRTFKATCKGLNTRRLTLADYERWLRDGEPPAQEQVHSLGFRQGTGPAMYAIGTRRGTDFRRTAPHLFEDDDDV